MQYWLAYGGEYDGRAVVGVYSTKEKAVEAWRGAYAERWEATEHERQTRPDLYVNPVPPEHATPDVEGPYEMDAAPRRLAY